MRTSDVAVRVAGLALAACVPPASHAQSFTPLGVLPGGTISQARGVSGDGSVVTGSADTPDGPRAFRWTQASGMQSLGIVSGFLGADGLDVSRSGGTIVGNIFFPERVFAWTQGGGMVNVSGGGAGPALEAGAVSANGSVIVGAVPTPDEFREAARRAGGQWQRLGILPGGSSSEANAVSDDGLVVVGTSDVEVGPDLVRHAFRWTSATGMVDLGTPVDFALTTGLDVSASGAVVVGEGVPDDGASRPIVIEGQPPRFTVLGVLPGCFGGLAETVSGDGALVGGFCFDLSDRESGLVWSRLLGLRALGPLLADAGVDLGPWRIERVEAASSNGRVLVGRARNTATLQQQAYRATLPASLVCYTNCDASTGNPALTPADFVCFLQRLRVGDLYANCDGSTGTPALTPADFVCFLNRYRAGC